MSVLSENEKNLLTEIVDSIDFEIYLLTSANNDKDRLVYLTCLTENEKTNYLSCELKKLQDAFKNCNSDISPYIFALIQIPPRDILQIPPCGIVQNFDDKKNRIISNFILSEYSETFDLITKSGTGYSLLDNSFKTFVSGLNFDIRKLDEFISQMSKAERYIEFCAIVNHDEKAEYQDKLKSKTEKLKTELYKYGFDKLPFIYNLSQESITKIIELLNSNKLPYQIAMLDYLGFIKNLEKEYFTIKENLYVGLSEIISADIRSVKGNLLVLNPVSQENKSRYTAHLHKETVQIDYQNNK